MFVGTVERRIQDVRPCIDIFFAKLGQSHAENGSDFRHRSPCPTRHSLKYLKPNPTDRYFPALVSLLGVNGVSPMKPPSPLPEDEPPNSPPRKSVNPLLPYVPPPL